MKKHFAIAILLILFFTVSISTVLAETPITQPFDTIGGIVTFGRYEQDGNEENGPEGIEWIVLDVQDGKVLLLSKYGLEVKPYNTEHTEHTTSALIPQLGITIGQLQPVYLDVSLYVVLGPNG